MNTNLARQRKLWMIAAVVGGLLCSGYVVGVAVAVHGILGIGGESLVAPRDDAIAFTARAQLVGFAISAAGALTLAFSLFALSRLKRSEHEGVRDLPVWK